MQAALTKTTNQVPVLEADDLTKTYGGGREALTYALRGVSFQVFESEFVAIIGPSGSGKSTLLNLIGALDRPTSGKVLIDGTDISKLSNTELARIRNRKIGFVFQSFNLINRISARENVELPLMAYGAPSKERISRAMSLLGRLGIAEKAQRKPTELSGGEQQRVAVARALAPDPRLILADEPTGNLDTKNTELMMDLFVELNEKEGKTIVLITHNIDVAKRAKKVVSIRDGKIEGIHSN
ncbi:MAG: ABC transporter ATP-binding protein [Nitrososphaerota archaeon]|nr:ABC transporter ATP-binding protein [Nitrososphaerota archaeon]